MNRLKETSNRINHYIPLIGILLAGTLGFIHFSHDRMFQATLAIAVAVSYVVWGIVHHRLHHDLTISVLIEYFVLASLGLLILLSIVFPY